MEIGEVENPKEEKEEEELESLEELVEEKSKNKEKEEDSKKVDLDLEDTNNLDIGQFNSSLNLNNSGAPVLENIESRIDRPGFVQMGTSSSDSENSSNSGSGRDDTYIPDQSGDNGPKYLQPGGEETNIKRVKVQDIGREVGGFNAPRPENFFISSESGVQPRNEHIGKQPERVDTQNIGRKNPLENQEVKYEEIKKYEFDPSK